MIVTPLIPSSRWTSACTRPTLSLHKNIPKKEIDMMVHIEVKKNTDNKAPPQNVCFFGSFLPLFELLFVATLASSLDGLGCDFGSLPFGNGVCVPGVLEAGALAWGPGLLLAVLAGSGGRSSGAG